MKNKELLNEVIQLKDFIEVKERISEMEIGSELDHAFAVEFLNLEYVDESQEVEISPTNKVETNYIHTETGTPAFLPDISTDNNLAVLALKDMQQNFNFEYSDNKFKVPYEDMAVFEGHTLGEAVIKAMLFGKAIQTPEVDA